MHEILEYLQESSPPLLSLTNSATDSCGGGACKDRLVRLPSKYRKSLLEDLAVVECKDKELPNDLSRLSWFGL